MVVVQQHADVDAFLDRAERWLQTPDALHNIVLSIAYQLRGDSHFEQPYYLATVESDDGVRGCALRAGPDGLFMTPLPAAAVPQIVAQARRLYAGLPEVIGPEDCATSFAAHWCDDRWKLHLRSRCYRLSAVADSVRKAPGRLRKATPGDNAFLPAWARDYAVESGTRVDLERFFALMLERGLLYVWDHDGPRCIVTTSKLTPSGAEISSLYTPPEHRRNGYATSAVAAASQAVLDSGRRFCIVGADEEAAGTRRMYERVGFEPISALVVIHLE